MEITRINNDVNGNPRFVIHFLSILTSDENERMKGDISGKYQYALKKASKLGGRKFHNKQFGGGIAFHCYNRTEILELVYRFKGNEMFESYCIEHEHVYVNPVKTFIKVRYIFDDTDICNLFLKYNPTYGVIKQINCSIFVSDINDK